LLALSVNQAASNFLSLYFFVLTCLCRSGSAQAGTKKYEKRSRTNDASSRLPAHPRLPMPKRLRAGRPFVRATALRFPNED
jgi:hypothetical protein